MTYEVTAKYREVRVAEADGYQAIGPDVPGMGIHYVRSHSHGSRGFDVKHPDILLYEKNSSAPGGYALDGVSYLLVADTDTDGQPKNPPFPKSLGVVAPEYRSVCISRPQREDQPGR